MTDSARKIYTPDPHRLLPQSSDAEKGVLSSFLIAPKEIGGLCAELTLTPDLFAIPAHALIYSLLCEMWTKAQPIDFILLTETLRDRGQLDAVGGPAFPTELFTFLPTAANAAYYIDIVKEKWTFRELIKATTEYTGRGYDEQDEDPRNLISGLVQRLTAISTGLHEEAKTWKAILLDKINRMETDVPDQGLLVTGLGAIDDLSPLKLGAMPIIAGEAKAGKSILAISIAARLAARGLPVAYFSLEDPVERVADRFYANMARLPMARHHIKRMFEGDLRRCEMANRSMSAWKFTLRSDVYDLASIVAVSRMTKTRYPDLAAIFVDYAQLVRGERRKGDSREQEVAGVSRTLRLLGIELNAAVILLSQLNADGATRESTSLEKDTTAIWKLLAREDENERLFFIPRQRDGESNVGRPIAFFGAEARVENLADDPT